LHGCMHACMHACMRVLVLAPVLQCAGINCRVYSAVLWNKLHGLCICTYEWGSHSYVQCVCVYLVYCIYVVWGLMLWLRTVCTPCSLLHAHTFIMMSLAIFVYHEQTLACGTCLCFVLYFLKGWPGKKT